MMSGQYPEISEEAKQWFKDALEAGYFKEMGRIFAIHRDESLIESLLNKEDL